MIGRSIAMAVAIFTAPLPANAQDVTEVGPWRVRASASGECQASAQFGEHVMLLFSEDPSGDGHLVFGDDRWILKDGDDKPATLSWDAWKTSREIDFTAKRTGSGLSILVAETGSWFTESLADANHLWLRVPGVDFDDDFEIPDALKVIRAIQACNAAG